MKVHFLTPTYDGSCHVSMAWSLIIEMFLLKDLGIDSTWDFYPGCCYVDISRNMLVDKFLKADCTDAFFIDTDVQWEPGAAAKILKYDRDIVAGIYPYKVEKERYPVIYEYDQEGRPIVDSGNGLILAKGIPAGFMRIRRNVFGKMIKELGETLIVEDHKDPDNVITYNSFFNTPQIGRQKWGEDLYFCNKWRGIGGEIWIDPDIKFWHHGMKSFEGNFHDYLRQLPGGGGEPPKGWKFKPRI